MRFSNGYPKPIEKIHLSNNRMSFSLRNMESQCILTDCECRDEKSQITLTIDTLDASITAPEWLFYYYRDI